MFKTKAIEINLFQQIERANLEHKLGSEINTQFLREMLFLGFNMKEVEFILLNY